MKLLRHIVFFVLTTIILGWICAPDAPVNNYHVIQYSAATTIAQPLIHSEDTPEVYFVTHGAATLLTVLQQANIVLFLFGCPCISPTGKSSLPAPGNALSSYLHYIYPFHGFW